MHAEGFSSAEVLHGPAAIVNGNFPIIFFAQNDETRPSLEQTAQSLAARSSEILTIGLNLGNTIGLPTPPSHPALQPLLMIQSFYRLANALSLERGCDPDRPPYLSKVTETV